MSLTTYNFLYFINNKSTLMSLMDEKPLFCRVLLKTNRPWKCPRSLVAYYL